MCRSNCSAPIPPKNPWGQRQIVCDKKGGAQEKAVISNSETKKNQPQGVGQGIEGPPRVDRIIQHYSAIFDNIRHYSTTFNII